MSESIKHLFLLCAAATGLKESTHTGWAVVGAQTEDSFMVFKSFCSLFGDRRRCSVVASSPAWKHFGAHECILWLKRIMCLTHPHRQTLCFGSSAQCSGFRRYLPDRCVLTTGNLMDAACVLETVSRSPRMKKGSVFPSFSLLSARISKYMQFCREINKFANRKPLVLYLKCIVKLLFLNLKSKTKVY